MVSLPLLNRSDELTKLREQNEKTRFERQHRDDSRTAIAPAAVRELERELRKCIEGEVRFDDGSRALYATDGSNYRQAPIGAVIPRNKEDVVRTMALAHKYGAPILSRGGGTSLRGQCCNVAVVMDFTKYLHHVLHIDPDRRLGTVEPGCVLDTLRHTAKEQHQLTFGPDPATHNHNAIGGMLGNDSCGTHSLLAAKHGMGYRTADNTHELEILTYDGVRLRVGETPPDKMESMIRQGGRVGEIYSQIKAFVAKYGDEIRRRYPHLPRRVSGYSLEYLLPEHKCHIARALVGSEGTLVAILEATMCLIPEPKARTTLVLGYPDVFTAGDHVTDILPLQPTALEGMDHLLFEFEEKRGKMKRNLQLMPEGKGFLLVEFGGDSREDAEAQARRCMELLEKQPNPPTMKMFEDPEEEEMIWKVREGGLGATAWVPGRPDAWPGWEDSAVPPEKVGNYLRDLRKLYAKYDYHPSLYGHLGQGCIHCRVGFDLYTAEGIKQWRSFLEEATDLVVSYGGSFSGEHGDGQASGEFLPKMFGETIYQAFREFKSIWDPQWKMNPGKKIDAYSATENLRLGTDYNPPQPKTHFHFPEDHGSFSHASLRCVGVGECRKEGGQVMCPSYQVTREEKDCTRGRAHLLWEMMNGEVLTDGWKSEAVRDSLDLCLACKGCKGDCPVNVDMATYKAEFLSHYYEDQMRPRHAYAMGWIYWWARLAALAPDIANFFSQTPGLSNLAKLAGGIAQERRMPAFARHPFKEWFAKRPVRNQGRPPVILWADTFNNHFHPEVAKAAVEVLEHAGYQVWVPQASLCCGRPLYDFGMLDTAKRLLLEILQTLQPQIEADIPVVGLEPSCVSVFRDEMVNLFPHNWNAKRLHDNTFMLSEFLAKKVEDYRPPQLQRKALVHGHCHHKSVLDFRSEQEILKKMGLDFEMPDPGCCGMAGSFGFEADHYDISMNVGEQRLLPAVRQTGRDTLIIADGFSCHEQIDQGAGRRPLHLAQVIQMALREMPYLSSRDHGPSVLEPRIPNRLPQMGDGRSSSRRRRRVGANTAALLGAAALAGGLLAWQMYQEKTR
ncbi:MAG TPA: FAD-binding and (Fe-S)-binding domain-containing protein [Gemmataceae bacterium]|nr:FAD-binding and (Fe-S)-binding domain-containing protein [Gemmataceae bacterium]